MSDLIGFLTLAVAGLASYRASRMVALEEGPFEVFAILRGKLDGPNWIGRGIGCPLCIGFWLSPILLLLAITPYVNFIVWWLAVAGLQTFLAKSEK